MAMMFSRLSHFLLVLVLVFAFAACGEDVVVKKNTGKTPDQVNVLLLTQSVFLPHTQDLITAYGFPAPVVIDNTATTPTVADLLLADVVFVQVNISPANATALGDVLADYVDAGGKLVLGAVSHDNTYGLYGRIRTDGYSPIAFGGGYSITPSSLGTIVAPSHPLMAGVTALNPGIRDLGALQPGMVEVAQWADGSVALATNPTGNVVAFNLFTMINKATGDLSIALGNALFYAATH